MSANNDISGIVRQLTDNEDQLAAAIEAEFVSHYGADPDSRQWLLEGRLANVIIFDEGNGRCGALDAELKNGTTLEELEARLTQAKHDCEFSGNAEMERYHANYPTGMVRFKKRRFPKQAVYQAAGMQSMTGGTQKGEIQLTGKFANMTLQEAGGEGHGVRIVHAWGVNDHEDGEFWSRLQNILNAGE